jgi:hypothetical protein
MATLCWFESGQGHQINHSPLYGADEGEPALAGDPAEDYPVPRSGQRDMMGA